MESEMKRLLERIPKEKHEFALQTLAIIASIKDECKKNIKCKNCRFYDLNSEWYEPCCLSTENKLPSEWDENVITERIYK